MKRALVLAFVVTGGLSLAWSQTPPPAVSGTDPDPVNFTGKVTGYTTSEIRTNRYTFAAGARSHWHTHERGQAIIVEQGRMRTQEQGKAVQEFPQGTTLRVERQIVHWHGALPGEPLTQVSVSFGPTAWMAKVTDQEYAKR